VANWAAMFNASASGRGSSASRQIWTDRTVENPKVRERSMAKPPDQSAYSRPLDTKPYTPDLTPVDIPPPPRPTDHTGSVGGWGPGEGGGQRDVLTELSHGDEFYLLKANNIDLMKTDARELGAMRAVVVGKTLRPANYFGVHFSRVKLSTPTDTRVDRASISYTEFESNLQRQTVAESSIAFGVPEIFKVDASYRDASAISTHDRKVQIFFQASQLIPKADVVFKEDDITLDQDLITKIEKACSGARPAENLLVVLEDYGQFVPMSILLGGRITLHTSTELSDRSQFEMRKTELKTAADARFSVDGVPVKAGGGAGVGTQTTGTQTLSQQAGSLTMQLRGGNEDLASSQAGTLGTKWISSVGPYLEWRTVGFYERSLVPIIEFLPEKKDNDGVTLREKCMKILREYFLSKLDCRKSAVAGDPHGTAFAVDISGIKRMTKIVVNHGINVDGLELSYEHYESNIGYAVGEHKFGGWRGEHTDTITLKEDEEITAIEAGIDSKTDNGIVRQVAFVTNRRRFPDTGFYGRAKTDQRKTIEAPRVRGIFGRTGALVHALGLSYLGLADDATSREYLLAMEPYLFPESDYGIIK
jgi:MAC/Perforin domain/Jacalin-like lectin domain